MKTKYLCFAFAILFAVTVTFWGSSRVVAGGGCSFRPSWSPDGTQVLFVGRDSIDGANVVIAVNADGTHLRSFGRGYSPSWSPDGSQVVFLRPTAPEDGSSLITQVVVASTASARVQPIVDVPVNVYPMDAPEFSPDGSQIAFAAQGRFQNRELYLVNADGTNLRYVGLPGHTITNSFWSPDGSRLFFEARHDIGVELYAVDANGNSIYSISNGVIREPSQRAWSPDGEWIAFVSSPDDQIYAVSADGSVRYNLMNHAKEDYFYAWSPDGAQIIFSSRRNGNPDLYVINADGSDLRNLTESSFREWIVEWSPDGARIAFMMEYDAGIEIFVMNADGSEQRSVTHRGNANGNTSYRFAYYPSSPWSPDGTWLAYDVVDTQQKYVFQLHVVDVSDPTAESLLIGSGEFAGWSPDGTRLLLQESLDQMGCRVNVIVVDVTNGERISLGDFS